MIDFSVRFAKSAFQTPRPAFSSAGNKSWTQFTANFTGRSFVGKHSISTYVWSTLSSNLSFNHLWLVTLRSGPMCPFEISNTKRGSVKDSYIALILMATQAPMPHRSSVESNNNFSSRGNSTENESEEISVREGDNLVISSILFSISFPSIPSWWGWRRSILRAKEIKLDQIT